MVWRGVWDPFRNWLPTGHTGDVRRRTTREGSPVRYLGQALLGAASGKLTGHRRIRMSRCHAAISLTGVAVFAATVGLPALTIDLPDGNITLVAFAAASAAPAAGRPTVKRLSVFALGQGIDRWIPRILFSAPRRFNALPPGAWGGVYTVKSGAHVTIYSSSAYPADPTVNQAAADFVDSLVHGSEISKVKIYFAPPAEVGALCEATEVDGCYFSSTGDLITTGEDTPWSTVEEVLAHQYGHHVATNRLNDPWPAVVYGTKRWATYEGVCQKAASGVAFGRRGRALLPEPRRGLRRSSSTSTS